MSNNTNPTSVWNTGSFDESAFINFDINVNENSLDLRFLNGEPEQVVNSYGKPQYNFEVQNIATLHTGIHSITSKRYMLALEAHHPIQDKALHIQRSGIGMETDYTVTPI